MDEIIQRDMNLRCNEIYSTTATTTKNAQKQQRRLEFIFISSDNHLDYVMLSFVGLKYF